MMLRQFGVGLGIKLLLLMYVPCVKLDPQLHMVNEL